MNTDLHRFCEELGAGSPLRSGDWGQSPLPREKFRILGERGCPGRGRRSLAFVNFLPKPFAVKGSALGVGRWTFGVCLISPKAIEVNRAYLGSF